MLTIQATGVLSSTGYSSHTLQLALAIEKLHPGSVRIESLVPNDWQRTTPVSVAKLLARGAIKENHAVRIDLPITWPHAINRSLKSFSGFFVWEGIGVPKDFVRLMNDKRLHKIFVPSSHVRNSALASGVTTDMVVVPHGVDTERFKPGIKDSRFTPLSKDLEGRFIFGFVGGWAQGKNDRKDLFSVVKAYVTEFKKTDPVCLLIHVNPVYNPGLNIVQELQNLGIDFNDAPMIRFMNAGILPYDALPGLYNLMNVLVCPSVEGFGLTFLEAMACGVPCIALGLGGQTDFINEKNGWLLPFDLVKATDRNIFYESTSWGKVRLNELMTVMRYAYEHKEETKSKGYESYQTAKRFTWENSAKVLLKSLPEGAKAIEEDDDERKRYERIRTSWEPIHRELPQDN